MTFRFQHRRVPGFRKPPNGFVAGRQSHLGNRYTVKEFGQEEAVRRFKADALADRILSPIDDRPISHAYIRRYAGRPMGCPYCRVDQPCHVDILLKIANEEAR